MVNIIAFIFLTIAAYVDPQFHWALIPNAIVLGTVVTAYAYERGWLEVERKQKND